MLPFLAVILNRNFRSLWLGQITSQVAINMMAFVLILRIYQTTSSNTAVSLLILMIGLPAIIFGAISGTLVDRWDKRDVLVVTNLVRMVLLLGFFISSEAPIWVYILVVAISISTQFFVPAEAPTIPRIVPEEYLLTANSLFTFTYYISMISGFILSGPALKFFGPRNVFLFISALLGLAAYFVAQISREDKPKVISHGKLEIIKIYQEFLNGLRFIKRNTIVFQSLILLTASQALIAALASLAPGFAHRILQIDVADASYTILGPAALGMIFGALLVGQFGRKTEKSKLISWGIFSAGLFLFALVFIIVKARNLYLAVTILFLIGAANALIDVPANTNLQEHAPAELRGRVYGVLTSLVGGAAILPVIFTGVAADLFGIEKVIFTISILILLFGIYRLSKERYNRNVKY
ncbi:MAG: MFS transporter [Candidatus Gottesmanbacteria bacterium]